MSIFWPLSMITRYKDGEPRLSKIYVAYTFPFHFDKRLKSVVPGNPSYEPKGMEGFITPVYVEIVADDIIMMKFSIKFYKDGEWVRNHITGFFKKSGIPFG